MYYLIIYSLFSPVCEGYLRKIILIPIVCDSLMLLLDFLQIKIYYANDRNVFTGKYFHDQCQNLIRKFVIYCITDIALVQIYVRLSADETKQDRDR